MTQSAKPVPNLIQTSTPLYIGVNGQNWDKYPHMWWYRRFECARPAKPAKPFPYICLIVLAVLRMSFIPPLGLVGLDQ